MSAQNRRFVFSLLNDFRLQGVFLYSINPLFRYPVSQNFGKNTINWFFEFCEVIWGQSYIYDVTLNDSFRVKIKFARSFGVKITFVRSFWVIITFLRSFGVKKALMRSLEVRWTFQLRNQKVGRHEDTS